MGEEILRDGEGLRPLEQVHLTVCGLGIICEMPCGCDDERDGELSVLGFSL